MPAGAGQGTPHHVSGRAECCGEQSEVPQKVGAVSGPASRYTDLTPKPAWH